MVEHQPKADQPRWISSMGGYCNSNMVVANCYSSQLALFISAMKQGGKNQQKQQISTKQGIDFERAYLALIEGFVESHVIRIGQSKAREQHPSSPSSSKNTSKRREQLHE